MTIPSQDGGQPGDELQLPLEMDGKPPAADLNPAGKSNGDGTPEDHGNALSKRKSGVPTSTGPLRTRMDVSFLEYASYVIRDRAIPSLADGLKPVQRRILYSIHRNDDGKFIKVANVVGYCMQFHPHGDASIGDALVVLTNKRYLIEGQGNFGNIFTGDPSAAARYIECRLTDLAREHIFNDELTQFVPSYDGRNKEPVTLPAKLPLLLMLGTEGIAVGLSAKILPHNFIELLEAQIAILRKKPFEVLPDFQQGCLMDASGYDDGRGSVRLRAKIETRNSSTLVIREIPPTTTTEALIGSIEDAAKRGKIKIKSISDFTSEKIEIEIKLPPGVQGDQMIPALYAFTDCESSVNSRIVVIDENRPLELTVSEVLKRNTAKLVDDIKAELELAERKLQDELHYKTLVRIFVENRIYKKIEECPTNEAVVKAVHKGFEPFRREMLRDLADSDVEMLLGVKIRRISLFDINKHREEMDQVRASLAEVQQNLKDLKKYIIARLQGLIKKYGPQYPRLTQVAKGFEAVTAKDVAFKTFRVTYDRAKGYIGHKIAGPEFPVQCSDYDKIVIVFKDGRFKVVRQPEKLFVGPDVVYCGPADREQVMTLAYKSRDATYLKRFTFGGTILDKDYNCIPKKCKIVFIESGTPEEIYIRYKPAAYQKINQQTAKPAELTVKGAKTRGNQISIKEVASITSQPPRGWDKEGSTPRLRFASSE